MPSVSSTAYATSAGLATGASGTNQAPPASRPDTSAASRVLPTPPGPVRVTRRAEPRFFRTRDTSVSRPTKLVSGFGTLGGVTEVPDAGAMVRSESKE